MPNIEVIPSVSVKIAIIDTFSFLSSIVLWTTWAVVLLTYLPFKRPSSDAVRNEYCCMKPALLDDLDLLSFHDHLKYPDLSCYLYDLDRRNKETVKILFSGFLCKKTIQVTLVLSACQRFHVSQLSLCKRSPWCISLTLNSLEQYMSHVMRKPVSAICEQQRRRSACTSAQSDQHLCCSLLG